jgi:hypothetical protein
MVSSSAIAPSSVPRGDYELGAERPSVPSGLHTRASYVLGLIRVAYRQALYEDFVDRTIDWNFTTSDPRITVTPATGGFGPDGCPDWFTPEVAVDVTGLTTADSPFTGSVTLAADDLSVVPLWWTDNVVVKSRALTGFTPALDGDLRSLATARFDGAAAR